MISEVKDLEGTTSCKIEINLEIFDEAKQLAVVLTPHIIYLSTL